ncbi:MAG: hypothetical protein QXJ07_04425 [Candidatus Bathyarchaeia archaeon]
MNISEFGDCVFDFADEWGRRKTDGLLEDGVRVLVAVPTPYKVNLVDVLKGVDWCSPFPAVIAYPPVFDYLADLAGVMEYVRKGDYVLARHPNLFADFVAGALDAVRQVYVEFKEKTGRALPDVEYFIGMAESRVNLVRKVKFGDIVRVQDHNLIIDGLKAIEVALSLILKAVIPPVVPLLRWLTELGDFGRGVLDEWGRRRIDVLLEDGARIVTPVGVGVIEVSLADAFKSLELLRFVQHLTVSFTDCFKSYDWLESVPPPILRLFLTEYGRVGLEVLDEFGRRRIDSLLEDGEVVFGLMLREASVWETGRVAELISKRVRANVLDLGRTRDWCRTGLPVIGEVSDVFIGLDWCVGYVGRFGLTEYGEVVLRVVDEFGRRKINGMLEDGVRVCFSL